MRSVRSLTRHWPEGVVVRVRMGLHTGEPQPTDEGYVGLDVHCAARIMSVAHGGQVLLSRATRDLVTADLPKGLQLRDLGAYRLKDIAGPNELFQLVIPDLPTDFPPVSASSAGRPLRSLPSPATPFIGREAEVTVVCDLLKRADVRMLTLIGTAGVGKTRLALRVADRLSSQFSDGLCFVDLDRVSGVEAVHAALAQALNVQEEKELSQFDQVKAALRDLSLLLILDNFERVLPASLEVADLLAACPKLKVLVTSRVMLHIQAEHLFEVLPLPLPDPLRVPALEELSQNAAIALFVQRTRAVRPDFQLTTASAPTVARICARLDGIPLAIELAAARMRHFTPQVLLAHLERGLAVLEGDVRDAPARQQTLRAAIAWSYDLLEPEEQRVFRRLAVCVNGATREAASRISSEAGEEDVSSVLGALVDKSMLVWHRPEKRQDRYGQLQTLREYGLERLAAAGELEVTRTAHASYYLAWAEQAAPFLSGAEQLDWLDSLDQEYENLRSALEWLIDGSGSEVERAEQALRLCIALLGFWEIRGYLGEGLAFLERALAARQGVPSPIQAQALHGAAFLALMQDDYVRAQDLLRECQSLFRESGDRAGMADILHLQGTIAMLTSSYRLARRLLDEALALYREEGDSSKVASTREALAQIAMAQGDYATAQSLLEKDIASFQSRGERYRIAYPLYLLARAYFLSQLDLVEARAKAEESLALFRQVGDKRLMGHTLVLLGQILLIEKHEVGGAASLSEESIAVLKGVGDRSGTAAALIALARVRAFSGEYEAARQCYKESWQLLQTARSRELSAGCLEGYGELMVALETPGVAAKLWGTAATVRAAIVAPMPLVYRASYNKAVALARERLGARAFQEAWAEGHALNLEQVTIE